MRNRKRWIAATLFVAAAAAAGAAHAAAGALGRRLRPERRAADAR